MSTARPPQCSPALVRRCSVIIPARLERRFDVSKKIAFRFSSLSFLLLATLWIAPASAQQTDQSRPRQNAPASPPQTLTDIRGSWSGTLFSNHANTAPFTITVVITRGSSAHLMGNSTLSSDCLRGAKLQTLITGTSVVLAGSDEEGDNVTIRGTLNASGDIMKASYLLNGSATGTCETDDGKGQLAKR
jgi:hypothetical protein